MQDLSIIAKINAQAAAAEIPQLRSAGKFVVALYSGLNYTSHAAFDTADQAQAYVEQRITLNEPGERTQVLDPISAPVVEVAAKTTTKTAAASTKAVTPAA